MEFRVLQYFLAVAREQSFTSAADYLHLSQPTLSRQLKDLEDELGRQLFVRSNRGITLTEEGMILRKRAVEMVQLLRQTEDEITRADEQTAGDVYIGAGESELNRVLARTARRVKEKYPGINFHIASGNFEFVTERLDKGLLDFGMVYGETNPVQFNTLTLPEKNRFAVLMREDSPLAQKEVISPADLHQQPIIVSISELREGGSGLSWLSRDPAKLNITATYTLVYNATLLVEEGLGYAICYDKLANTAGNGLCYRPLTGAPEAPCNIIWKKFQILSKPAEKFLACLQEHLNV